MAAIDNLKPTMSRFKDKTLAIEAQKKGLQKRRALKTMREALKVALALPYKENEEMNNLEAIVASTVNKAISGDMKAVEFIAKLNKELEGDIKINTDKVLNISFIEPSEFKEEDESEHKD